jgi:hypothetical protein
MSFNSFKKSPHGAKANSILISAVPQQNYRDFATYFETRNKIVEMEATSEYTNRTCLKIQPEVFRRRLMRSIRFVFNLPIIVFFVCLLSLNANEAFGATKVEGVVFHDRNENGKLDRREKGIKGVYVSNGVGLVKTDSDGRYTSYIDDTDDILFVVKPSGWNPVRDEHGISRFYYVHKPNGSKDDDYKFKGVAATGKLPAAVNFPLYPAKEPDTFKMICFGDTQPRSQEEVDYIAHDVVQELVGFEAAFGITLGDVVFNNLALLEPLQQVVSTIGVPWYNIHGNHDINFESSDDKNSDETWERLYGPNYYSFNYSNVHFVVVDNITYDGGRDYHGELGAQQLEFLKNDLATVPKNTLVVLLMHIPLHTVRDQKAVYELLDDFPNNFTIAAHWHRQAHFFLDEEEGWMGKEEHHHLVHATVCGSWWSGAKDEYGIPHATMADGAPNGYSIVTFSDNEYSIRFKAARRPADHQMNIYAPETLYAKEAADTQIAVNVFAGSERSAVEMRLGKSGKWIPMELTPMFDPAYMKLKELEPLLPRKAGRPLPDAHKSTHIWTANLPKNPQPGLHLIEVRTTDMFGQTYTDKRSIRIED